ncbi:MAG: hypothetical protein WCP16_19180 [Pseudanabaena sp. ELA645]
MKILLGSKLIVDIFLNRSTSNSPYSQMLCDIIFSPSPAQFHLTRTSLDMIHSLTSIANSVKGADALVSHLEFLFTICEVSPKIFENARHRVSEIYEAIDLECCLELGINAIVTILPDIYIGNNLPVWSVEKFIQIYKLENSFTACSNTPFLFYQQNHQLSFPFVEDKDPSKYMIRNRMPIIKKALAILKTAGFRGLTKQEFATKLGSSETTTRSVIWDLERFGMALSYRDKVEIDPNLLDTGESDISSYLSIELKDLAIVQQIYREIERDKAITKWRLQEIIANIYSRSEFTKNKSKSDYRSRIISWLLFATHIPLVMEA